MTSFHPNSIARRGRIASIGLIMLFGLLAGRFFLIQILQHQQYALQSDQNRLNEVPIPAPRGIIYDRNGLIIAENIPGYTVSILSPRRDSLSAILGRLSKRISFSRPESIAVMRRRELSASRPTVIFAEARFETVSILEEHRTEFPGLIVQAAPKRFYADSSAVSAFVGYTNEVSEADLDDTTRKGYKSGQQIGKAGLELQYESILRGLEGSRFVEVDARQRVVREIGVRAERAAVAGPPLHTNIDLALQRHIAKLFGDSIDGGAVVLDPKTGAVLALVSAPGYDPNRFVGGISNADYRVLNEDPRNPMRNKAIQGAYAPGSTWKLATAILGLEQGKVGVHEYMPKSCTGGFQMGNRRWRCWQKAGHGPQDLISAIRNSCDVYFYQLGQRLTFDGLIAGGRKLGFGERTGIDLPHEGASIFPPLVSARQREVRDSLEAIRRSSARRRDSLPPHVVDSLVRVLSDSRIDVIGYYNARFKPGGWSAEAEELNLSIGQGANSTTLISITRFYTALATNGRMARPMIVGDKPDTTRIFKITDAQMQDLRTAMMAVVSTGGTAASANIKGVNFAGKTGSAQNERDKTRDDAWFVGFAPAEDPKVVVGVFLEFGLHGYLAARVAKSIVEFYLKASVVAAPAATGGD